MPCAAARDDASESGRELFRDQDVEAYDVGGAQAGYFIRKRSEAGRSALETVEETAHEFAQRHLRFHLELSVGERFGRADLPLMIVEKLRDAAYIISRRDDDDIRPQF